LRRPARMGARLLSPGAQRHSYPFPKHPEDSTLSMVRMAVAERQPIRDSSHSNQFTGDLIRHGQQRSHIPLSPPTFSRSDGSGYTSRGDAHAIRPAHNSHFIPAQQPPRQVLDDRGTLGANRPILVRSGSPERQPFASRVATTTRPDIYAHDFVRPVEGRDPAAPSRGEAEAYLSRHSRAVPVGNPASYSRMEPGRLGGETRFMPPAAHASRSPSPPLSFSKATGPSFGSHNTTHALSHAVSRPVNTTSNHRRYAQEAQNPGANLPEDGRYAQTTNSFLMGPRILFRCPPVCPVRN
jgi:hypothetical protein